MPKITTIYHGAFGEFVLIFKGCDCFTDSLKYAQIQILSMISSLMLLFLALGLAYLLSEVLKKFGLPRVTGQIFAGFILGLGLIKNAISTQENIQFLSTLASLGLVLLFYYIGLEINFKTFSKNIKKAFTISVFKTILPFSFGFSLSYYVLNLDLLASSVIGLVLSVNALAVSADLLEELKLLKTKFGKLLIATGAVDDLFYLFVMVIVFSFFHSVLETITIPNLVINTFIFLLIIIFARLWFVPKSLKYFDREKSSTSRFTASLIILFLMAALAELLGIGTLIGAMIAGMIVRQTIFSDKDLPTKDERDISKSLHIVSFGFLIPLFFVWVGFNTNLSLVSENIGLIIALTLLATIGAVFGTVIAFLLNKGSWIEGILAGLNLNAKGDIDLVIATLALNAAIISNAIFTSLVLMSVFATIISPIMFKWLYVYFSKEKLIKL